MGQHGAQVALAAAEARLNARTDGIAGVSDDAEEALDVRMDTVEADLTTAEGTIASHTTDLGTHTSTLSTHTTQIAARATLTGAETLTNKVLGSGTSFTASPTGDGVVRWAEFSCTGAEVKALVATPKTVIAAPGAGKTIEVLGGVLLLDYATTPHAEDGAGSNLQLKYTDGSGVAASEVIEMTGFITQAGDYQTNIVAKKDIIVAKAGSENQAVVIHNVGAGEIVTGDSPIRLKVAYRIWPTGF